MQHDGFHHANCLATQLRDYILSQNTDILAMLQAITVDMPATKSNNPPFYAYSQCNDAIYHSGRNPTLT